MAPEAVLVVEDDPVSAEAVGQMLRSQSDDDLKVLHADRIAAAKALLREEAIGCIFLDLGLPDAAGLEGLRNLLDAGPDVPIIVLSATDDEVLAVQAIQEGARDYVPKSAVTGQLLKRLMEEALRSSDSGGDAG